MIMNEHSIPDKVIDIDLPRVMKQGIYLTVFSLTVLLFIHFILEGGFYFSVSLLSLVILFGGYLVLVILHEFFHLVGFRFFANVPWKRMNVGVDLKMGIAYATTDKLMTNHAIRKALLLPFWLTGVLPALVGLYIGSGVLIILSAFLIGGAAGDFAMYRQLKRLSDDWLVKDDPQLPRLYVFKPDKLNK